MWRNFDQFSDSPALREDARMWTLTSLGERLPVDPGGYDAARGTALGGVMLAEGAMGDARYDALAAAPMQGNFDGYWMAPGFGSSGIEPGLGVSAPFLGVGALTGFGGSGMDMFGSDLFGTGRFLSPVSHAAGCPCGAHEGADKQGLVGPVAVSAVGGPDIGNTRTTAQALAMGSNFTSTIDVTGDSDWFRVRLEAGQTYIFTAAGTGTASGLNDPTLTLRNASGVQVAFNDDSSGLNSAIRFTVTTTGTYYLDVQSFQNTGATNTGDYVVSAAVAQPLREFTYDEIADQLTNGYWGGPAETWDVEAGDTITVNITGLIDYYQFYAREALELWSDLTGITFREVATGGQIVFDDTEEGAFASTSSAGGFTTSARVNVSTDWSGGGVGNYNSYTFQTFIHEIGHVLGLGHGGNYNGDADYASDALYLNDSWATTVMSYFDQRDNTFFAERGFTRGFTLTPMVADVLAIQNLYGLSTTTRAGDTVYGFNSTAGREVYDARQNAGAVYTVFDAGGIDTLDYSGHTTTQLINLNAETFSNVGGRTGNVSIARGTIIENAIGGSGDDTLIGNAADNRLDGRGGTNRLEGGLGNDTYVVASTNDTVVEAASAGTDTVLSAITYTAGANIENVTLTGTAAINATGNNLANVLTGNAAANTLNGGGSADRLDGGAGADTLIGGTGNDVYVVDNAGDVITELAGGGGADAVIGRISWTLGDQLEWLSFAGSANLNGTGNALDNRLFGNRGDNQLNGMAGNDRIDGGEGRDILTGGAGNDRFTFDDGDFAGMTTTTAERITDFATGDLIDLRRVDAITGGADNRFTYIGSAAFTGTAGELRYQQIGTSTVVMGDQNGDGVADFWLALTGTRAMVATDFAL